MLFLFALLLLFCLFAFFPFIDHITSLFFQNILKTLVFCEQGINRFRPQFLSVGIGFHVATSGQSSQDMRLPRSAKAMDRPRHIEDLADELLSEVLSFLLGTELRLHDAVHTNNPDPPSEANGYGERLDLDRFRLVNKRFMRIGTPRKFSRFVLRFSRAGFQRLEHFMDMQLACYVRHFTYMVRPFYQGSGTNSVLPASTCRETTLTTIPRLVAYSVWCRGGPSSGLCVAQPSGGPEVFDGYEP